MNSILQNQEPVEFFFGRKNKNRNRWAANIVEGYDFKDRFKNWGAYCWKNKVHSLFTADKYL